MLKKRLVCLFAVIVVSMGLGGCGKKAANTETDIEASGEFRVAVLINDAPYSSLDTATGTYTGSDIELAEQVAKELGVPLKTVPVEANKLVETVESGAAHAAIGRIVNEASIQHRMSVSIPYAVSNLYVVTQKGRYASTLGSLKEKNVGVSTRISDTIGITINGVEKISLLKYQDLAKVEGDLIAGNIYAYLCYRNEALEMIKKPTMQAEVVNNLESEQYVMVINKNNPALLEKINVAITAVLTEEDEEPEEPAEE